MSHRSPVTLGRQLHCPLRGSQDACRDPSAEQLQGVQSGKLWKPGLHSWQAAPV